MKKMDKGKLLTSLFGRDRKADKMILSKALALKRYFKEHLGGLTAQGRVEVWRKPRVHQRITSRLRKD